MSIRLVQNSANNTPDIISTFYTAPSTGKGTLITSFTATNNSGVNASYTAYIDDGTSSQPIIPFKIVLWKEVDYGAPIVNQLIPANHQLRIESSAADSIYFNITGRAIT